MSLAKKVEEILKNELNQEDLKTVVDIVDYLQWKKKNEKWSLINESENEYITDDEVQEINSIKARAEYITQDEILSQLGISKDEL